MIPTIVVTEPDTEPEMVVARFKPEEVERAIGAAFAIGIRFSRHCDVRRKQRTKRGLVVELRNDYYYLYIHFGVLASSF